MNYEEMSDYEINRAVASYYLPCDYEPNEKKQTVDLIEGYGDYSQYNRVVGPFDPCNNPSDAWPIIVENKISLISDDELWESSFDFYGDLVKHGTDELLTNHAKHKNPLRAAMIVYLMMKDVENETH